MLVAKESAAEKRFLAEADAEHRQERKRRRDAGEAVDDKESDEDDDEFLAVIEGRSRPSRARPAVTPRSGRRALRRGRTRRNAVGRRTRRVERRASGGRGGDK